nr:AGE family epimerase/isomerase [Nocardioides sp. MAH-18]
MLDFGDRVIHPDGGAAVLGERGDPLLEQPVQLWITARTLHVYALGTLLGVPGSRPVAEAALAGITGRLADAEHGGWRAQAEDVGPKSCYDHAFVLLAASSGVVAGLTGSAELFEDAQRVFLTRFWDDGAGMVVDAWDAAWSAPDPYRGLNSSMHSVEALLATADVTGDRAWLERAARVAARVVELGAAHDWRLPEHFATDWTPVLDHNRDRPADPFKPYGATVGHGLEWSRLLLQVEASGGPRLTDAAVALYDRAVADGWQVDGAPGFVYTTDWAGVPVVRQRMHWVAAEAIAAAAALWRATGEQRYADDYARWWDYAARHLLDHEGGSWWHELDPENRPAAGTWSGKPDLYHAVQACLLPRLPVAPSLATALRHGMLDA